MFIMVLSLLGCGLNNNDTKQDRALPYRFVDQKEAIKYYLSNDDYFNSFPEYDIQFMELSIL